jgi:hypothetical protein
MIEARTYTTDDVALLQEEGIKPNNIMLIAWLQKLWDMIEDINAVICKDSLAFVLQHKPIFDEQKLILISMQNFAETILKSGNLLYIKTRSTYQGKSLAEDTFSKDWNIIAQNVNGLITEINFDIFSENATNAFFGAGQNNSKLTPEIWRYKWIVMTGIVFIIIGIGTIVGILILALKKQHI